jgi:hypothetical protein
MGSDSRVESTVDDLRRSAEDEMRNHVGCWMLDLSVSPFMDMYFIYCSVVFHLHVTNY